MLELVHVGNALPFAADEVVSLRIGVDELAQRQVEFGDVLPRELVPVRDAHGARLAVQPVGKAERARAAADVPGLRFEDRDAMAAALELVRGDEAGQSGADDDDVQRWPGIGNGRQRR